MIRPAELELAAIYLTSLNLPAARPDAETLAAYLDRSGEEWLVEHGYVEAAAHVRQRRWQACREWLVCVAARKRRAQAARRENGVAYALLVAYEARWLLGMARIRLLLAAHFRVGVRVDCGQVWRLSQKAL